MRSLSAALPYPPKGDSSNASAAHAELTNKFSGDFLQAQIATANRSRFGKTWPLWEFWDDQVAGHMKSIDELIGRLCREAMQRKSDIEKAGKLDDEEEETLLEHLVKLTDGKSPITWWYMHSMLIARFADVQIIRDETLNILLAGRDTVRRCRWLRLHDTENEIDRKYYDIGGVHDGAAPGHSPTTSR